MKKSLLILFTAGLIYDCSSTETKNNTPSTPNPPRYFAPSKTYTDKVNLSELKLEPILTAPNEPLSVFKGSDGNNYLFFNLIYKDSGLSIVEAIKSGEILENKIIVRDQTGKVIGSEAVNIQDFTQIESKANSKLTLKTLDGFQTTIPSQSIFERKESETEYTGNNRFYTALDKDVYQIVKLNELPPNNSYVSVQVFLTYAQTSLQQICSDKSAPKDAKSTKEVVLGTCKLTEEEIQKRILLENKDRISKIETENKSSKNEKIGKKFYVSNDEYYKYKDEMKKKTVSSGSTLTTADNKKISSVLDVEKAKLNFREWNLFSEPRYFQVNTTNIKTIKAEVDPTAKKTTEIIQPKNEIISIEGYTETVVLKSGQTIRNVKTETKDNIVIVNTSDGKKLEVNKQDITILK